VASNTGIGWTQVARSVRPVPLQRQRKDYTLQEFVHAEKMKLMIEIKFT